MTEKIAIKQFEFDCPNDKVLDCLFQEFDCGYEPNKFDYQYEFVSSAKSWELHILLQSQFCFDTWHDNYISNFGEEHDEKVDTF